MERVGFFRGVSLALLAVLAVLAVLGAACAGALLTPEARQALAPSGKLRVGVYQGSPTSIVGDPASGSAKGVGFDLGRELARRAGLAFEPVVFSKNADLLAAVKAGAVDMSFTNATSARMMDMDFSAPVFDVEQGYLVPPQSRLARSDDIDAPGVRVGVSEGSTSEATLPRLFKHASIVHTPTLKAAVDLLATGQIDAFATNKAILYEMADSLPGSTVLAGRWGLEHFAIAIPKGRRAAMSYVDAFVADAKAQGVVARTVERAGLRGTVAAEAR